MLLSVTGASGAGKSTALAAVAGALARQPVACVEFDSVGVPPDVAVSTGVRGTSWRHGVIEHWVQRPLVEQHAGRHLLLCGQVPVGELLAAPSADKLSGIAVCLLHCSPGTRRDRLVARGEDPDELCGHLAFGEWFYRHTLDPEHKPEVIGVASPVPMCWERWEKWKAGDPRWAFEVIDTDALTAEHAATLVVAWAREALAGDRSSLSGVWWRA